MARRTKAIVLAVCVAATLSAITQAQPNVEPGLDYFQTVNGTRFNFGGDIGIVEFKGNPIDPGNLYNTDTIVERKKEAVLNPGHRSDRVPIEMVALSLVSVEPVYVLGFDSFFDVFVVLDLGADLLPETGDETPSLGRMRIRHRLSPIDDGMNTPEGTFDSAFRLYLDALFVPVGQTEPAFVQDIDNLSFCSDHTPWSHSHDAVPPLPGTSNFFLGALPHFPLGLIVEKHPGVGVHRAENVTPEPTTIMLLGLGAVGLVRRRKG